MPPVSTDALVVPVSAGQIGITNNWTNVLATLWCGEGEAK